MNRAAVIVGFLLVGAAARAQDPLPAGRTSTITIESPRPKDACEGTKIGEVCGVTGKRYYGDPLQFDGTDKTFKRAATRPGMLLAQGIYFASVAADAVSTQHCININTCQEGDPLLGHSSAAWRYVGGALMVGATEIIAVEFKKHGHGILGASILGLSGAGHFLATMNNLQYRKL